MDVHQVAIYKTIQEEFYAVAFRKSTPRDRNRPVAVTNIDQSSGRVQRPTLRSPITPQPESNGITTYCCGQTVKPVR